MSRKERKHIGFKCITKALKVLGNFLTSFSWVIALFVSISVGLLLFSSVMRDMNLVLNMIFITFSLGSFCFLAGTYSYEKNDRKTSKKFFRLAVYFMVGAIFLLSSFLSSSEGRDTCMGFKFSNELGMGRDICYKIKEGFPYIGIIGSFLISLNLVLLVKTLSEFIKR